MWTSYSKRNVHNITSDACVNWRSVGNEVCTAQAIIWWIKHPSTNLMDSMFICIYLYPHTNKDACMCLNDKCTWVHILLAPNDSEDIAWFDNEFGLMVVHSYCKDEFQQSKIDHWRLTKVKLYWNSTFDIIASRHGMTERDWSGIGPMSVELCSDRCMWLLTWFSNLHVEMKRDWPSTRIQDYFRIISRHKNYDT